MGLKCAYRSVMVVEVCPSRLLTVANGTPRMMSHEAKVWREVVEVEIRQSCGLTGPVKAMPHIIPPMPGRIMEDPRHIEPSS